MLALAAYLPYLAAGAQSWAPGQTCVLSAQETLPGPVIVNPDKSGNTSLNVSASPEPSAVTCSDGTTLWSNPDEVLAVAYEAVRGDEALVAAGTVAPAPQAALHYFAQQKDFAPVGTAQLDVGRADAGIGLAVDYLAQVADLDGDGRWTDVDKVVAWHPMSKQTWQDASGDANATAFWSKQLVTADGNYSWAVAGP